MGLTDMEFGSTFKRTTAKILTHSIAGVKSYLVRIIFFTSKKIIVLPLWYYNFFYLTTLCTCFPQFYSISPTKLITRSLTLQQQQKYLRQTPYVQSFILPKGCTILDGQISCLGHELPTNYHILVKLLRCRFQIILFTGTCVWASAQTDTAE